MARTRKLDREMAYSFVRTEETLRPSNGRGVPADFMSSPTLIDGMGVRWKARSFCPTCGDMFAVHEEVANYYHYCSWDCRQRSRTRVLQPTYLNVGEMMAAFIGQEDPHYIPNNQGHESRSPERPKRESLDQEEMAHDLMYVRMGLREMKVDSRRIQW